MESPRLHPAQIRVLDDLRHHEHVRFSDLMRATDMTSDTFKFHVRKLLRDGLVQKAQDNSYTLTATGKEYANNLDIDKLRVQKQPKLSVLIIVPHPTEPDMYLFQKRQRSPYYGFWSCIGGPVLWGESTEVTAERELLKQTGLRAQFSSCLCLRKRDYDKESNMLLEDKLFMVLRASQVIGELHNDWPGGQNVWMTIKALQGQEKVLYSAASIITASQNGEVFTHEDAYYETNDY